MERSDSQVCPDCGALGCREKFDAMLALEFESPTVFGAVHHITVICYNLQHPATFTEESLSWMRSQLKAIIKDGLSAAELRKRAQKQSKEGTRIKRQATRERVESRWSMTVADIRTESPEQYSYDVLAWARSILKDLKKE